tara:strand:+ start:254 stop:937 length:684 start_codon:yes stop_codon:yes gene_type:complete
MDYWGTPIKQPPEVLALHNQYRGERLFVFGTGPSLKGMSLQTLDRLQEEHTFTSNKISLWEDLPFDPEFHGLSEHESMPHLREDIYDVGEQRFACHWGPVDVPGWQWVAKAPDGIRVWKDGMVGLGDDLPPLPSAAASPITLGVQLGVWMGFDPIYLLGCDNSTTGQVFADIPRVAPHPDQSRQSAATCFQTLYSAHRSLVDCTPGGDFNERGLVPYKALEDVLGIR